MKKALIIAVLIAPLLFQAPEAGAEIEIDIFDFASTETARAAWKPGAGASPVGLAPAIPPETNPLLRFPCNFSEVESRCYWDVKLSADFTEYSLFDLTIYIDDPIPFSSLTFYFRSGDGWFPYTYSGLRRGWQTLSLPRDDFDISGSPAGWDQIDGVRFSPWKAIAEDTEIIASKLTARNPKIAVVKGTKSTYPDTAESTTELMADCLNAFDLEYAIVSEESVEAGALDRDFRLAIFPYSNNMSAAETAKIQSFVSSGGKIIVFFTAPAEIFSLLGLRNNGSSGFGVQAMRFRDGVVDCVPSSVKQNSWQFFKVEPISENVRILAFWDDEDGAETNFPAWTVSDAGAYMSHILLDGDLEKKKRLTLALIAHFLPEVMQGIIGDAAIKMGRVGEYGGFDEAAAGIRAEASETSRTELVESHIASAGTYRDAALDGLSSDAFCLNLDRITSAKSHLLEAYYYAQSPRLPELRGVWASYHDDYGPYVEGWDDAAADLAAHNFNAVFPFMLTGGVAYYDSEYLPRYESYDLHGDQIAECVRACHAHGVEVHVRKLTWFLYRSPQSFIDDMRAQERTQVNVHGEDVDSLCPSHPLNFELERNAMLEVIDNYDVDGIHYDFIRYPNEECCYCSGCLQRFQNDTGLTVSNWPGDCYDGIHRETYREWRREQITRLVRAMREKVDKRDGDVKISAAVFSGYPSCATSVAQDWVSWLKEGYLDFACPMNYTDSQNVFRGRVTDQMNYVGGAAPLYPGIGVTSSRSDLSADQCIAQIKITRELDAGGFVIFVYKSGFKNAVLPNLVKGITAAPENCGLLLR